MIGLTTHIYIIFIYIKIHYVLYYESYTFSKHTINYNIYQTYPYNGIMLYCIYKYLNIFRSHLMLTWWPIMQKVRSSFLLKHELLIKLLFQKTFPHGTWLCRLCIIFSLWGRFPMKFKQVSSHFTYLSRLLYFSSH